MIECRQTIYFLYIEIIKQAAFVARVRFLHTLAHFADIKIGSIGKALDGGKFEIIDEKGNVEIYTSELTENDKIFLCARLELMFKVWIKFYDDILNDISCGIMIRECIGEFDVNDAVATLKREYSDFLSDKVSYLYNFYIIDSEEFVRFLKLFITIFGE